MSRRPASSTRRTRQRRAIRKAFEEAERPLGPQEVLDLAQTRVPGLGIATVYRNLRSLVEEGALRSVELPGAASRYELTGKAHHHHFCCEACDRVFDIEGCAEQVAELAPDGFRLESHEILLYGLCPRCAADA